MSGAGLASRAVDTLVVQVHPLEDSFNAAVLDAVIRGLHRARVQHRVVRLYDDPQPSLSGVSELIVVYPTWWGGQPARLLAWLQQTLGPYVDGPKVGKASPLSGVRHLAVVTTHGSSKLMNLAQGEPGLQTLKRVVLPLCAPGAQFEWLSLYKIDRTTESQRREFLEEVEARFAIPYSEAGVTSATAPS